MRILVVLCIFFTGTSLGARRSWGETAFSKAFIEQRKVVAVVSFERDSSTLSAKAINELESALPLIHNKVCENRLLRVEGYSSKEGSAAGNFRLSVRRAHSVARLLEKKGLPCMVGINGYGALRAGKILVSNDRRVEIVTYPKTFLFDFDGVEHLDTRAVKSP